MPRRYHYWVIVLKFFVLGCGDPPPVLPAAESYRITEESKPSPLSEEWKRKLHLIDDQPGKEIFANNIQELKPDNREAILEILNSIPDNNAQLRFLQDLSSFDKTDQAHLINIILYLETRNKPILFKLAQCAACLSVLEKLKMLNIIHDLDKASQHLIEEFEQKLEEDPE